MTVLTRHEVQEMQTTKTGSEGPQLTGEQVWHALSKASFAVISHVTPGREPRSSGVLTKTIGHRLYVATAPDSWKARHIGGGGRVALTVPVRRGGLLSLVLPIPPATISFHGRATVHAAGSVEARMLLEELGAFVPPERRDVCAVIEIIPEGEFLTYGIGVPLMAMRTPSKSKAHTPVP